MGHSGFTGRTEGRRRNQNKHKALGLCVSCSRKAVKGKVSCQYHRDLNKKYYQEKIKGFSNSVLLNKEENPALLEK